jgi:hypothetical protein
MLSWLHAVSLVCLGLFACDSVAVDPTHAQRGSDIVVQPSQQSATMSIGQTISIPRPFDAEEWRVDYSADVLELLNAAEARRPGPAGWRFRGIAKGETDVAVTEVVTVSAGGAPPAPRHFVIAVRVTG